MSKDLFLMMREQEISTENFLPTKKEILTNSEKFAKNIVESGEYNLEEIYAQALRLKEALSKIESVLKSNLAQENFESYGIKGTYRSDGETLNYSDDEIYNVLKSDLDARVELLKLAQKQDVFDASGNEVPKVSKTPRKASLAITF